MGPAGSFGGNPGAQRAELEFAEAVREAFAFLRTDFAFRVTACEPMLLRFESANAILQVQHGRMSFEIGVEVRHAASRHARCYGLRQVLAVVLGADPSQNAYYLQASNRDAVRHCVQSAAALVREHYRPWLEGRAEAFDRVEASANAADEAYTKEVVQQPTREAADRAWCAGEFA